jgi:ABC-type lipoprotein release transport system permease subunit
MILIDVEIAARNLLRHTRRNAFLALAIAAVTAVLVALGGFTEGIRSAMLESASALLTGHVNVGGYFKVTSSSTMPLVADYRKVLAETRRLTPEIEFVTTRERGFAKAVSEGSSMNLILEGVDVAQEPGLRKSLSVQHGSLDDLAKPGTLLLFEDQAKRLGVGVGDVVTLSAPTARGTHNTADIRVVAIARNLGLLSSFTAFLPSQAVRDLYHQSSDAAGVLQLYLKDPSKAGQVAARLRDGLAHAGWRVMDADPDVYWNKLMKKVNAEDWRGQKLDLSTWQDELSFLNWILSGIDAITGALLFVLLVIVLVGILNSLGIAIRERTREIGTVRAIGMQRARVLRLFLIESLMLGVAGATAGALLGFGAAAAINALRVAVPESMRMFLMQDHVTLTVSGSTLLAQTLFVIGATTLAAVAPALQAARLKPITAMHHIG